jgi:hypothetical protein
MRLFACCCGWSWVIGKRKVYGPVYAMRIGDYPQALSNTQRMMMRKDWEGEHGDCSGCAAGAHRHSRVEHSRPEGP